MNAKIAALTLALLPALAGARDLGPGTFELSGGTNLSFGSTTFETKEPGFFDYEEDVSSFTLQTDALYYVARNFGLGLALSYTKTETDIDNGVNRFETESSMSFFGPEVKFNIPVAPSASVLVGGAIGRLATTTNDVDADGWALSLGAGMRFFLADSVAFDGTLNFLKGSVEGDFDDETDITGWNIGLALSVFFGGR